MMDLQLTQERQSELRQLCQKFLNPNVAQPGLSFSIKTTWQSYTNQEEPVLLFAQVDWSTGTIPQSSAWTVYRLRCLRELIAADCIKPSSLGAALSDCMLEDARTQTSYLVLLHAAAGGVVTCFTQPLPILAQFYKNDGEENLRKWSENCAQIYPFLSNMHHLSKLIAAQTGKQKNMILMNRGMLVTSDDLETCLQAHEQLVQCIENHHPTSSAEDVSDYFSTSPIDVLPSLRRNLSKKAGYPLIVHLDQSKQTYSLLRDHDRCLVDLETVWLPDFADRCTLLREPDYPTEADVPDGMIPPTRVGFQPGYILSSSLGMVATGRSAEEAHYTARVALTNAEAISLSMPSGELPRLNDTEFNDALQWQGISTLSRLSFSGEIALVTGAASGIGKACAAALLARGAAVVGVDINPRIEHVFEHPSYYGFVCDITNEAQVQEVVQQTVRRFGGLDMLILNAGLFPSGCHIKSISLAEYTRVIDVNLTANLVLLREAYPLLVNAPLYGRVVMIGSKNMKAPGPGAVAYSTSKAALTQMARVAAMEWAQDGIRVNVIHPDSVFDTGLYTEEVLQARAAHYGLTVDQYKKRNLLKTEITSREVGEMVAEMCGSLFRSITGAQIQLDGGNERTI
jgi:NAD(P)-dependent dehydrogenase (short-subunit alcohol dehydrogenase family)/rhamnose utilization protein RhaD (predicted bifunctional aldolase and dehydrogenase)